jgi:hypothetical protein
MDKLSGKFQCCGSWIKDPVPFGPWIRDPGFGMGKKSRSGSGIRILDEHAGSGIFFTLNPIRDGQIRIRDPG